MPRGIVRGIGALLGGDLAQIAAADQERAREPDAEIRARHDLIRERVLEAVAIAAHALEERAAAECGAEGEREREIVLAVSEHGRSELVQTRHVERVAVAVRVPRGRRIGVTEEADALVAER